MVGGSLTSSARATGDVSNAIVVKTTGASAVNRPTMFPPEYFRCAKNYFLLVRSCHRPMAMATSELPGEAVKRTHCRGIGIDKSLCCCRHARPDQGERLSRMTNRQA